MAKKRKAQIVIEPPVKAAPSAQRVLKKSAAKKSSQSEVLIAVKRSKRESLASFQPKMTDPKIFDMLNKIIRKNAKKDRWMPDC